MSPPDDPPPVAPRYREVLRLVCRGAPNKEIAQATGLSAATVRTYVSELMALFGVANRTELALAASTIVDRDETA
ncbi:MAG: response regulator transcription factor [Tepidiformaceae bacterium]